MNGIAQTFSALALQSDMLQDAGTLKYLSSPVISNYTLDQQGNVIFTFSSQLVPSQFLYKSTLPQASQ
jgi:hypothetical protein